MLRYMVRMMFASVAVACAALSIHAGDVLQVGTTPTAINVDGVLDEYVYVGYDWSSPFIVLDREHPTRNGFFMPVGKPFCDLKTQAGAFSDDTNLYISVIAPCANGYPAGAEDGVGVAISPDGLTVFVANCDISGRCAVVRVGEDGVRSPIDAKSVRAGVRQYGKRMFEVEMALPYAIIGHKPNIKGSVWKCNIYRTGLSCGGTSSWSSVQGDMYNPDRFKRMVFDAQKPTKTEILPENKNKNAFLWTGGRWGGGWFGGTWRGDAPEMPMLDKNELGKVLMYGPRGGRAVAHFRMSNLTDRPALYSLKMTDSKTNVFAQKVRFREVVNMELKGGTTVPDPIFDLPNGSVLRIPPKSTAIVWVDVNTEDLAPGIHKATLRLTPGYSRFEEKTVSLELNVGRADVREIDMPCWAYPLRHADDFRSLRDYRFNVSCMTVPMFAPQEKSDGRRDWAQFDETIAAMLENGIRTNELRILVYTLFPKWQNPRKMKDVERRLTDSMRAGIAYARKRYGIGLDRIWFSTVDEPHGDPEDPKSLASYAFYGAKLAKCIDPGLKSWTNPYKSSETQYLQRYLESFDALAPFLPVVNSHDPTASERYARSGKDIWSYTIYLKQNRPAQYRGISWQNFAYGFEGPATFYDLFEMADDGFNSYDKNGAADYGAVYRDSRTKRISPSLRLEAWYQGHIEQRLLKWCRNRISKMADNQKAERCRHRLKGLVKRAVAPRPNFDLISRELLDFSDGLAK